jgi:hypothetical protein
MRPSFYPSFGDRSGYSSMVGRRLAVRAGDDRLHRLGERERLDHSRLPALYSWSRWALSVSGGRVNDQLDDAERPLRIQLVRVQPLP